MDENLKQIRCRPECGFMVRSHSGAEVIELALMHVKRAHPTISVSPDELRKRIRTI